jgi:hypothetical protein
MAKDCTEKFTPQAFVAWVRRWGKYDALTIDAAKPEPPTMLETATPTVILDQRPKDDQGEATVRLESGKNDISAGGETITLNEGENDQTLKRLQRVYPKAVGIVKGRAELECVIAESQASDKREIDRVTKKAGRR